MTKAIRQALGYLEMGLTPIVHLKVYCTVSERMRQKTWKINLKDYSEDRWEHCQTNIKATH